MSEFIIETSKSSRASCRKCRSKIAKGELRFGEMSDMSYGDEPSYRWFHLNCAAQSRALGLEQALNDYDGDVPDLDALKATIEKTKKKIKPAFPYAETAPSGRSKCLECSDKIEKGDLRVAIEREVEMGDAVRKTAGYLHPDCAYDHTKDADMFDAIDKNSHGLTNEQLDILSEAFS